MRHDSPLPARPADTVVLVHGTRTSRTQWDLQRPLLGASGYHVLTPDLPGHGQLGDEGFSLERAVRIIHDSIAAAAVPAPAEADPDENDGSDGVEGTDRGDGTGGVEDEDLLGRRVHLVGSSLGGFLAIHAAAIDPTHLASVTACGAAVQPTPRTAALYGRLIELADRLPGSGDGSGGIFRLLLGAEGAQAYMRGGRADVSVVRPAMQAIGGLDLAADLHRIDVPVTFLHGRLDQMRLHEKRLASAARNGRLEVLPYGTHLVNLTEPERFTADLVRVLREAA